MGAVHANAVPLPVTGCLGLPPASSLTHGLLSRPLTHREDLLMKDLVEKYKAKAIRQRLAFLRSCTSKRCTVPVKAKHASNSGVDKGSHQPFIGVNWT